MVSPGVSPSADVADQVLLSRSFSSVAGILTWGCAASTKGLYFVISLGARR